MGLHKNSSDMDVKIMDVTKIRSLLFFVGVCVLGLASVAIALNHKQGTLTHPQHASAIAVLGGLGLILLYTGTHLGTGTGTGGLTSMIHIPHPTIPGATIVQPVKAPAAPAANTTQNVAIAPARNKVGKFDIPPAEDQDFQAIYHLAEVASHIKPELRADVLDVCRDLNDKLFVIHHNVPIENQNDPKPKNPTVAS